MQKLKWRSEAAFDVINLMLSVCLSDALDLQIHGRHTLVEVRGR